MTSMNFSTGTAGERWSVHREISDHTDQSLHFNVLVNLHLILECGHGYRFSEFLPGVLALWYWNLEPGYARFCWDCDMPGLREIELIEWL